MGVRIFLFAFEHLKMKIWFFVYKSRSTGVKMAVEPLPCCLLNIEYRHSAVKTCRSPVSNTDISVLQCGRAGSYRLSLQHTEINLPMPVTYICHYRYLLLCSFAKNLFPCSIAICLIIGFAEEISDDWRVVRTGSHHNAFSRV